MSTIDKIIPVSIALITAITTNSSSNYGLNPITKISLPRFMIVKITVMGPMGGLNPQPRLKGKIPDQDLTPLPHSKAGRILGLTLGPLWSGKIHWVNSNGQHR
jgi:hypothetical protein